MIIQIVKSRICLLIIGLILFINVNASNINIEIEGNNFKIDTTNISSDKDLTIVFKFDKNLDYGFKCLDAKKLSVELTKTHDNEHSINFKIEKQRLRTCGDSIIFQVFKKNKKIGEDINIGLFQNNGILKPTPSILYNAIIMQKNWNGINQKIILDILSTYAKKKLSGSKLSLEHEFKDNRFLENFIKLHWGAEKIVSQGGNSFSSLTGDISTFSSSIGSMNVTTVADGFAKFIVKRTKQELSITFFEKFKNRLDSFPDLRTVFPQTYIALAAIDKDIYMFQVYIQTLRESFENDLASLPSHLPSLIENHQEFFDKLPTLKAELLSGFYIAQSIQNKDHPGEIIENFDTLIWKNSHSNYEAVLKTFKLLSTSLKDSASIDSYWAPYTDIRKLSSDEDLLKIYLGLVELQAKQEKITFKTTMGKEIQLSKIIDTAFENFQQYKPFIQTFSSKTKLIEDKIKRLKNIQNDSLLFENYYGIALGFVDLMKFSFGVQKLPGFSKSKIDLNLQTKKYFEIAQTSCNIGVDINRRNYSSAIVNVVHIYDIISNDSLVKYNTSSSGRASSTKREDTSNKFDTISKLIFRYGSLMATVAQANSSDEVQAAIEAFSLPTGSARIKREAKFNVALNAYCGLFIGEERIKGVNNWQWNSYGIAAPIGISVSCATFLDIKKIEVHVSHTLFLSLIDLGAITAFRFNSNNDSVKTVPIIQLKDIISPGIFYSLGLPRCPISLSVGWQVGPLLREVTATKNNYYSQSYSRFSISLLVDIPILNFHTTPKDF